MAKKAKKNVMLDTLTGEQFKTLIEQFSQDGKIDTIPELLAFLSDIPEGQTLGEYIEEHGGHVPVEEVQRVVDETLEEQAADHDDVDEIFDDEPDDEPEEEPEGGISEMTEE